MESTQHQSQAKKCEVAHRLIGTHFFNAKICIAKGGERRALVFVVASEWHKPLGNGWQSGLEQAFAQPRSQQRWSQQSPGGGNPSVREWTN